MATLNVNIGYDMKDFFYMNAIKSNDMPDKTRCEDILNRAYQPTNCQGE